MANSTTNIQQVIAGSGAATQVNENFDATSPAMLYGRNAVTSTGFVWGFVGGWFNGVAVANGNVTLTASATNYLVADRTTGAVSAATNTVNWLNVAAYLQLYEVVTGASTVTSYIDRRQAVGASGGSGGGITGFTASINSAAPNATDNASVLQASGGSTIQDAVLSAKGGGAIQATVADSAAAGGNKRGTQAVDWQTRRSAADQVASGTNSNIGGGYDNKASGNDSTVAGGRGHTASAVASTVGGGFNNAATSSGATIAGGGYNTASQPYATISGGNSHTASGAYSNIAGGSGNTTAGGSAAVGGGNYNEASGEYSHVPGGYQATTRGIYGAAAHAAGNFATVGDAQRRDFVLRTATTNATITDLSADGATPAAANQLVLPNAALYGFEAMVTGRNNGNGDSAVFRIVGAIKRGASAGTTALLGTPVVTVVGRDAGATAWDAVAAAETTLGALRLRVTGAAATNIRWVAHVKTTEVVG